MSAVDAFHATISDNDVPRCQDLQDVALCSLAQAIDTGKTLVANDVIEFREIYESDHPILCPGLVCIVNVTLQVPKLDSVERYYVELDAWSSPISGIILQNHSLSFTVRHQCIYLFSRSAFFAWGYKITLVRYVRKSSWNCTVLPPSFALGWSHNSSITHPAHGPWHLRLSPAMRQIDAIGLASPVSMAMS
jgi:hypothetical protein